MADNSMENIRSFGDTTFTCEFSAAPLVLRAGCLSGATRDRLHGPHFSDDMMTTLKLLAGPRAFAQIRNQGLAPEDISAVFGASGAAKWLTIYGLDRAIFSDWLALSSHPVDLFGTSVGAFKLAAAAQRDPAAALTVLADAYIAQQYVGSVTAAQIALETRRILAAFLPSDAVTDILQNPRYNYHCASVRCLGMLADHRPSAQKLAMLKAFVLALGGRKFHQQTFERVIFHSGATVHDYAGRDGFTTHRVALTPSNFVPAILSSGSIPVLMPGVTGIDGAPSGVYRDGGLLDYHAVPTNVTEIQQGLVLYPHFYPHIKEGWFDKFAPWRKVTGQQLDDTLMVCPSAEFVSSLPGGVIPDRRDFVKYQGDDPQRMRRWAQARDQSLALGEEFLQLARTGDIAGRVELLA